MTTRGVFIKSKSTGSERSNGSHTNNRRPRRRASLLEELDTPPSQHSLGPSLSRRNSHGSNYTASSNNTAMVNNKTAASASVSASTPATTTTTTATTTSTTATTGGGWSHQSQSTLNNSQPLLPSASSSEYPKTKLISSSSAGATYNNSNSNNNVSPTRSTFFVKSTSMRTTFNIGRRVSTGDSDERHTSHSNHHGGGGGGGRGLLKSQLSFRRLSLPEDGKKVDHDGELIVS